MLLSLYFNSGLNMLTDGWLRWPEKCGSFRKNKAGYTGTLVACGWAAQQGPEVIGECRSSEAKDRKIKKGTAKSKKEDVTN